METQQEFIELMERYKRIIYKVCFVYAPDREQVEDYYQEVVLALWRSRARFRGESAEATWVYRIALYTCLSFLRRRMRRPACVPLRVDLACEDDAADRERIEQLYASIARLGQLDRALVLLWLEEHSYAEIADVTGLTPQNVAVRLTRIREKLRRMNHL